MTKLLEKALAIVRGLPPAEQDEIAQAMLSLADREAEAEEIDPTHLPDVLESLAQARRREFATDAEVEALFDRLAQLPVLDPREPDEIIGYNEHGLPS